MIVYFLFLQLAASYLLFGSVAIAGRSFGGLTFSFQFGSLFKGSLDFCLLLGVSGGSGHSLRGLVVIG